MSSTGGSTGPITREELNPPSFDDFEVLKQAVLQIGEEPDARLRLVDPFKLYIKLERDYCDLDYLSWPPLTKSFVGFLTTKAAYTKMVLRYRELSHANRTVNSAFTHDYILRAEEKEVVEFGHSMVASPPIRQPRQELFTSDEAMDEAVRGEQILKANTGRQLQLSGGDCEVLYDRLLELLA